jgi:hypothetical protein
VRRCLGLQVLELLRRGGTPQYLIAVWVPTEACYDVAGSLRLYPKTAKLSNIWAQAK